MNILLVSEFAYPVVAGTERHVFGLAKYLKNKHNCNIVILTPNWNNLLNRELIEGIKFYRFNPVFFRIGFFRLIYYFLFIFFISFKEKIDVIHSFYTFSALASASFAGFFLRKKTILTLFEPEPIEAYSKNKIGFFITKLIFSNVFKVTTLNWALEKKVKKEFKLSNVITVPNWVSNVFFDTSISIKIKKVKKRKRILFVGRLCEQKGCFVLINAFSKIIKKINSELVFVGPPHELIKAKKLVRELNIEKNVLFKGIVSEKELVNEYALCDVLIYPSLYKGGFGFTVIEAMAFAKPVIVSDDLGIPEAAGNAGLVSKKGDFIDLSKKIIELFSNDSLYQNLSKNALKRANLFTEEKIIEKYFKLYIL